MPKGTFGTGKQKMPKQKKMKPARGNGPLPSKGYQSVNQKKVKK